MNLDNLSLEELLLLREEANKCINERTGSLGHANEIMPIVNDFRGYRHEMFFRYVQERNNQNQDSSSIGSSRA